MGSYSWIYYRARINLFEDNETLLQGPFPLQKKTYDWPFTFSLPLDCTRMNGNILKYSHSFFDNNPLQTLPPSIKHEFKGNETRDSFYVSYELNVELQTTKSLSLHGRDRECKETITVIPYRPILAPPNSNSLVTTTSDFECRSLYLNPSLASRAPTFTERMKSKLSTSSLPSAFFTVAATIPTIAILGQPLPIHLSLTHDTSNSTVKTPPQIHLKACKLRLIERTHLRALHDGNPIPQNLSPSGSKISTWDPEVDFATLSKSATILIPESGTLDLSQHMDLILPTTQTPSFKTFNIGRSYALKLVITIECAKEKFTAQFVVPKLLLLSAYHSGKEMNGNGAPPTFEQSMEHYGQNGSQEDLEDKKDPNGPGDAPQGEVAPPPFETGVNGHSGDALPGYGDVGDGGKAMKGEKEGEMVYQ